VSLRAQQFHRGDVVATIFRYGGGLEKHHVGEVTDVGARGVRIKFRDPEKGEDWFHLSRVLHVVGVDGSGAPVTSRTRPEEPERPKLRALPPPAETAPTAAPPSIVDAFASQGIDPLNAWLAFGRELVSRAEREVLDAEARVRTADAEVTSARQLLEDAERSSVMARAAADKARVSLAEINHRIGGTK